VKKQKWLVDIVGFALEIDKTAKMHGIVPFLE
jgi:hypothetical protein